MVASFQPDGRWFVFDDTGRTKRKNIASRADAEAWIYSRLFPRTNAAPGAKRN